MGTWKTENWREKSSEKSDLLRAMTNWQSALENMSGLAAFYEDLESESPIPVDLLLQSADYTFRENFQAASYLGNVFELHALGAAPMVLNMSFVLVGNDSTYGKPAIMHAYLNILRAEACAMRKKLPILRLPNMCISGAVTSLRITDDSSYADTVSVNMAMNVFSLQVINGNSVVSFDYQHGQAKTTSLVTTAETKTTLSEDVSTSTVSTTEAR